MKNATEPRSSNAAVWLLLFVNLCVTVVFVEHFLGIVWLEDTTGWASVFSKNTDIRLDNAQAYFCRVGMLFAQGRTLAGPLLGDTVNTVAFVCHTLLAICLPMLQYGMWHDGMPLRIGLCSARFWCLVWFVLNDSFVRFVLVEVNANPTQSATAVLWKYCMQFDPMHNKSILVLWALALATCVFNLPTKPFFLGVCRRVWRALFSDVNHKTSSQPVKEE
jgi:hypothetical protein